MDASPTGRRIAVVGAGISGLAAARAVLAREPGARVSVLESAGRIGGVVAAAQLAGLVVDTGADRLLAHRPAATDLVRDVGLEPDLQAPATLPRSLLSGGALVRLPARGISGIPTDLAEVARSGVLDRAALARLPLDHVLARTGLEEDVAVGAYVQARLGRAVVDRLVAPLLAEVHAGDVDSLSMRATMPALYAAAGRDRSLLRAARVVEADTPPGPRHLGLRGGLSRLPAALAAAVVERGGTLRLGTTVRALTRTGTGWRLVLGSAADPDQLTVDSVVLAVPAAAAGRLLAPVSAPAAAILREVRHASVATVTLAYRSSELTGPGVDPLPARDDGGFVVAADGTSRLTAVTFPAATWPWLGGLAADAGLVLVRALVGRVDDVAALQRTDQELVELVHGELAYVLRGGRTRPVDSVVARWGGALPQYEVGHLDRMGALAAAMADVPGVALCGAVHQGTGIEACVASAQRAAAQVTAGT